MNGGKKMGFVKGLKCRECGKPYPKEPLHVCSFCFGPLEVDYDYDGIKKVLTRKLIESRGKTMWRYQELLPIDGEPTVGAQVGFTPLVKANNLAKVLGVKELYVKNDSVNYPTFSFKDRVVSTALTKAKEFGFKTVGCATTGNLGNAVAAQAVQAGLESYIIMPADLEQGKIIGTLIYGANVIKVKGNYDTVNKLCSEIADKYGWAIVNVNLRPYYGEGSKTFGYEILEQLGWKAPKHIVVPMAGGSLITKIEKGIKLLARTEGIFTETAGGVTVAVTKKLIEQGKIPKDESIVISVTGNGLKTQEAVINKLEVPRIINPSLAEFDAIMDEKMAALR